MYLCKNKCVLDKSFMEKIPVITLARAREEGSHHLRTLNDQYLVYKYSEKEFNYKSFEEKLPLVQTFKDFLEEIPSAEERKAVIMEEFQKWDQKYPDIEFAAWLIQQYKTIDIKWRRDQWRIEQAAKGEKKSWEELLKERDEEIAELKSQLGEKDVIIAQKNKEHDEYVANHSTDDSDGSDWMMKINKADIHLSFREYTIILYTLFRLATNKEKLSPNLKRLIGSYNTISSYINDLKKEGRTPLNEKERNNIKKVLNSEKVPYREILKDYL